MKVSVAYISASINRQSQTADASSLSLVAFGSSNLIALWDTAKEHDRCVHETLPGHEGLVTCIRFVSDNLIVSADDEGVLMSWRKIRSQWASSGKVQAHSKAVSSLCVHEEYLVTGSSDAYVKIWKIKKSQDSDDFQEEEAISLHGRYPLSLALTHLPQSKVLILAIGGTDRNAQIWIRSEKLFVRSAVLSGHEDWVRSLAFRPPVGEGGTLVLASGSQDATIRLWNIEVLKEEKIDLRLDLQFEGSLSDVLDTFGASLGDLVDAEGGRQVSLNRHIIPVKSGVGSPQKYSITFDALLIGHEAGITSLSWRPTTSSCSVPTLMSTSTDSSLILWSPSTIIPASHVKSSSIWINRQRFGDVGGQKLGGIVGGIWLLGGNEVSAWGWSGGWRRWRRTSCEYESNEEWTEVGAVGGHNGAVRGLSWSPNGEFVISAGVDQTSRIHGAIRLEGETTSWHELSRPQIHGYDLLGVAFLNALCFVSIADEKVARVFEAPRNFLLMAERLGVASFAANGHPRPFGASVPPLGLSNKASTEGSLPFDFSIVCINCLPAASEVAQLGDRRPFEGELAAMTLWPEIEKVFGHGYESISLTVSTSRRFIATSCRATSSEHAVVRVYETGKWQLAGQPLEGHSLTITRTAFSPNDQFILSVSRDRSWRLYEAQVTGGFIPVAADRSHSRIIWDCAWSHEGDIFVTASRDKTVKIWQPAEDKNPSKWVSVKVIKTKEAATAVDFTPVDKNRQRRLAIGLETGEILIYSNDHTSTLDWKLEVTIDSTIAHIKQIYQLAWRPTLGNESSLELASCSEDGTLKILIVQVAEALNNLLQ